MKSRAPIKSWDPVEVDDLRAQTRPLSPLDSGRVDGIIKHLTRERDATDEPLRRARIDWAIGQLYEDILGHEALALSWYQRAYQAHPEHLATLKASRRIFSRAGRWGMALRLLNQEITVRQNPAHIAELYCRKAGLYLFQFDRVAEARACFRKALEAEPENETAARCLAVVRREDTKLAAQAQAWSAAAENSHDPRLREACFIEAAEAQRRAGDLSAAIAALEAPPRSAQIELALAPLYLEVGAHSEAMELALGLDPTRVETQRLTEKLADQLTSVDPARAAALLKQSRAPHCLRARLKALRSLKDWGEAARCARRLVKETSDPAARALVLWDLAKLEVNQLNNDAAAIDALEPLLEIDPSWPLVEPWTTRLYERQARLRLITHQARLSVSTQDEERVGHLILIAEARAALDQYAEVIEAYEAALARAPTHSYAYARLTQRLLDARDWPRLLMNVSCDLESRALTSSTREALSHALLEAQALSTDTPEGTLTAWLGLLKLDPGGARALKMARGLARRLKAWPLLRALNQQALARTSSPQQRLMLLMSQAETLERLEQPKDASELYLEILTLQPLFVPARLRLRRLCDERADWTLLARAYRLALRAPGEHHRQMFYALGILYRELLHDVEGARFAFERALQLAPGHLPSLMALRALAREAKNPRGELELLKALLSHTTEPSLESALLCDMGEIYMELEEPGEAEEAWLHGLERNPSCWRSRRALLNAAARSPEALAQLAEWEPLAEERVELWLDVARWSENPAQVEEAIEQVLIAIPDHLGALLHHERLAIKTRDIEALYEIYERLAQITVTKETRWRLLLQKARLFGQREDLERVCDLRADHPEIVGIMGRLAFEDLDGDRFEQVHAARLETAEGPEERLSCLTERAQLMRCVGLNAEAVKSYEQILTEIPGDYATIEALRDLCDALGDSAAVKALAAHQARISMAPENASARFMEAGLLAEEDSAAALEAFMEALQRNPSDPAPMAQIQRLTERRGDWRAWVQALSLEALAGPEAEVDRALKIAELQAARLSAPAEALETLRAALGRLEGRDAQLLQRIGDLCTEVGDWAAAAEAYEALRRRTPDEELQRALIFRLVAIYSEKLGDDPKARALLEPTLERTPRAPRLIEALADLATRGGAHDEAVGHLKRLSKQTERAHGAELKLARALMSAGQFEEGFACMRRLWMLDPNDEALFDELNEFAARARRPDWLHELIQGQTSLDSAGFLRFMELLWSAGLDRRMVRAYLRFNIVAQKDLRIRAFEALILSGTEDHRGEAREIYEDLLQARPMEIAYVQMLHQLYRRLGEPERAEQMHALLKGLRRDPSEETLPLKPIWPLNDERWLELESPEPELALLSRVERAFPQIFQATPTPTTALPEPFTERFAALARCFDQPTEVGLDPIRALALPLPSLEGWVCGPELPRAPQPSARFLICAGLVVARWHLTALIRWPPAVLQRRLAALLRASGRCLDALEAPPQALAEQAEQLAAVVDFAEQDGLLDELAEALPRWDLEDLARRARGVAYRVGLVYAGRISAGLAGLVMLGEGEAAQAELIRFWMSPAFKALGEEVEAQGAQI